MTGLTTAEFAEFFDALWGYEPFPWQQRLLERVVKDGWPHTLDLPTGSGKTSALDIAMYALAVDAERPASERTQPRRAILVVDRRVIVDQGYVRACQIRDALEAASGGILARVRAALRGLHSGLGSERAVATAILRGGMVRDSDWARSPDQPLLAVSTVDQVGSRLLFRGYGVSDSMAPVHAGLLGNDAVFLLDEVHLSRPFEQTLTAISRYGTCALVERPIGRPIHVTRMSATVGERSEDVFELQDDDRNHAVLKKRLEASKPVLLAPLISVPADETKARPKIAKACVQHARELFEEESCEVAAIIVNRVDTAREAAALAGAARWVERGGIHVVLITGRMRALDRQQIQEDVMKRVGAGRSRPAGGKTLLISTQAIEAGADFDFDALITECASLDALRQRFGRLDRRGEMEGRARGVVLASNRSVTSGADDPIYGRALLATWEWLQRVSEDGQVDFGIAAQTARGEVPADLLAPSPSAPALLPAYLDIWAQTNPKPAVEPDVPVFLHGPERGGPDVQILWRAELGDDVPPDEASSRLDDLLTALGACPPSSLETLSVPIWTARSWLAAVAERSSARDMGTVFGLSDIEGESPPRMSESEMLSEAQRDMAPALVWRGDKSDIVRHQTDVKPGQTLVVPCRYGGLSRANWDPTATEPVHDRGDEAQLMQRGRATLRWSERVVRSWLGDDAPVPSVDAKEIDELGPLVVRDAFTRWAEELGPRELPAWAQITLRQLTSRKPRTVEVGGLDQEGGTWRTSVARRRLKPSELRDLGPAERESSTDISTADDTSSFTGRSVGLKMHLEGVRDVAEKFATAMGLGDDLRSDLALAGWLHDLGKADPRFQLMLHGGDQVRAALAEAPLAKSALPAQDREARERARRRARYPRGQRHELMSIELIESKTELRARARDWDLVLHLVGSHHGRCRPFAPVEVDEEPVRVAVTLEGYELAATSDHRLSRFDSGVARRYWRLVRRYGWHGLAFLEATLRLADHRESELEADGGDER